MTTIWILDCSCGLATRVRLSAEKTKELEEMDDSYEFICKYMNEMGIDPNASSYMITDCTDDAYEVEL